MQKRLNCFLLLFRKLHARHFVMIFEFRALEVQKFHNSKFFVKSSWSNRHSRTANWTWEIQDGEFGGIII